MTQHNDPLDNDTLENDSQHNDTVDNDTQRRHNDRDILMDVDIG
jgi:hypothetical protein